MKPIIIKEIVYQLTITIVLFLFFSFIQDTTIGLEPYKIAFYCNYLFSSLIINYILLPYLYYRKRLYLFFGAVCLVIAGVILVDEFVLEQIYFPDTRGRYFPGVLFTLLETLPIFIIFLAFKFAWDFIKKQGEIEQLKSLVKENELQYLKSQINPHFLFNNLNNLYAYAIENSPKTPEIILELSSVLRYMLYECKSEKVSLNKEIKHLKDYTALNELRIEHRGEVSFSSDVDTEKHYKIAPLMLIVFVENAFKHSTSSQLDNIKIEVNLSIDNKGLLNFVCKNSFLPNSNTENLAKGIGLENVKKQLNLLYPNSHILSISSENNCYVVQLTLMLESE